MSVRQRTTIFLNEPHLSAVGKQLRIRRYRPVKLNRAGEITISSYRPYSITYRDLRHVSGQIGRLTSINEDTPNILRRYRLAFVFDDDGLR